MEQWSTALKILGKTITNLENSVHYQTISQVLGQNKDILKYIRAQKFILTHPLS